MFGSVLEWSHYYNKYLYVAVWICNGLLQSTGWPTVVAVMGNWFGRSRLVPPSIINFGNFRMTFISRIFDFLRESLISRTSTCAVY